MKSTDNTSRAIAILGMHRSGTSTVARAVNLLGVPFGAAGKMMPATGDNPEGYWEHLDIHHFQIRLLARMGRDWDTVTPLPYQWLQSKTVKPFKADLASIIATNFGKLPLWAWKEPRSCILLPLWREVLMSARTELSGLFVVRNPMDVAGSLMRRDDIPFNQALGIWFHYNIAALKGAEGMPLVFLSYEKLLADWEPEMRRCAQALNLAWPADEQKYRSAMNAFIQPGLQHNRTAPEKLQELPQPVRELYEVLQAACQEPDIQHPGLMSQVNRLSLDFRAYTSFFPKELERLSKDLLVIRSLKQDKRQPLAKAGPKPSEKLFGKKLCRSICKRLAVAYDWFCP